MLGERCEMSGRLADTNFIYVFLYHDGDQHTVSLEPTYYGELGAHLSLFLSVNNGLWTYARVHPYAMTYG